VPDPIPGAPAGTPTPRPYTAYLNLPKVETTGLELETTWRPTDNLRFLFNYGYINPEIKGGPILINSTDPYALNAGAHPVGPPSACTPRAGETHCQQGQSIDGNILPSTPKNKIAVNGVYTFNFENGSHVDTSLSYFWQDISYTSIFNRSFSKVPAWDQWDGRVSWVSSDNHFTVIAFAKNIFNELQYDSRSAGLRDGDKRDVSPGLCGTTAANTVSHAVNPYGDLAESCLAYGSTYRPPRTYGVELQFKY
jgi:iron complex outermembrane receptor protein